MPASDLTPGSSKARDRATLYYQRRAVEDLHAILKSHGDWMELGSADEQKPAGVGTVEAWARSDG